MISYTEKLRKIHIRNGRLKKERPFTPTDVKKQIGEPEPKKEQNEIKVDHWQPRKSVGKGFYKK
jgi:hypothetical protein